MIENGVDGKRVDMVKIGWRCNESVMRKGEAWELRSM
jgi:hypothetical protein